MRNPVLKVEDLSVHFEVDGESRWFRREREVVRAVDGVSFELGAAETLGIVGESGCGKSTLARAILGLVKPDAGRVVWLGDNLIGLDEDAMRKKRRELQLIFQDPLGSLDPRMTVGQIVGEPLRNFFPSMSGIQVRERVAGMLKMVGIAPELINRYPHEFSGGQCQRIGIARALVVNPRLVVCDEPVSALDVSIQAQIVNLLKELQKKLQLSLIFIAHDLSVVQHVSDRVLVMYLGKVMEIASRDQLYADPRHPYTRALIEAVPIPDPVAERARQRRALGGELPSPTNPPSGCVFRTRCPYATDDCARTTPPLDEIDEGRRVACIRQDVVPTGRVLPKPPRSGAVE
ncbi:ATP-binding cassette domain-containing protein [Wenzhouxiangella sp. XN79A]|uniref:ABC transporter ATP-binding protein n=1 Tax=Wenzhouxiangella sp. XN79A TaxID=2724193 RepID=UPI00144A6ED4|nr:oligopeptide/dipeptide ABC transporter ATP-binding protein [Wenzhouxiangella sp. XN79A]NKI33848.1 ATP-binding cassette domain-containing protein [Wenzhouxiangella sp. XN79A]